MSGSRCQRRGQGRTPSFGGPPRVAMVSVCGAQPGVGAFKQIRETYGVGSRLRGKTIAAHVCYHHLPCRM